MNASPTSKLHGQSVIVGHKLQLIEERKDGGHHGHTQHHISHEQRVMEWMKRLNTAIEKRKLNLRQQMQ